MPKLLIVAIPAAILTMTAIPAAAAPTAWSGGAFRTQSSDGAPLVQVQYRGGGNVNANGGPRSGRYS